MNVRPLSDEDARRIAAAFADALPDPARDTDVRRHVQDKEAIARETREREDEKIRRVLDVISAPSTEARVENSRLAQEQILVFSKALDIMKFENCVPSSAESVMKFAEHHRQKFEGHKCHLSTCSPARLPSGKHVNPLTGQLCSSDGTLFICMGLYNRDGTLRPGSLNLHWCDLSCTVIEMQDSRNKNGVVMKDEVGHCPISGMAKFAQKQSVPTYSECKMSTTKLNEMFTEDKRVYTEGESFPSGRHKGQRKLSRRHQPKFSDLRREQKLAMEAKFKTIMALITSPESQKKYFYTNKFLPASLKAFLEVKKQHNACKKRLSVSEQFAIFYKLITESVGTPVEIRRFANRNRYPYIFNRITAVWDLVVSSPFIRENSTHTGSTKRNKPVRVLFENICSTCIFAMAGRGIFINHCEFENIKLPENEFCFLGSDEDIESCAIDPDKIESIMSDRMKSELGLKDKTFRINMKIITESISSYVRLYAREAKEDISLGDPVEQVVDNYLRRCAALRVL